MEAVSSLDLAVDVVDTGGVFLPHDVPWTVRGETPTSDPER